MKKFKLTSSVISLMFFFALTVIGCAQTGPDNMDTSMDSMNEGKMDSGMEKSMDTTGEEKMNGSMKKDMGDNMK